jgi:hypothetical protein
MMSQDVSGVAAAVFLPNRIHAAARHLPRRNFDGKGQLRYIATCADLSFSLRARNKFR